MVHICQCFRNHTLIWCGVTPLSLLTYPKAVGVNVSYMAFADKKASSYVGSVYTLVEWFCRRRRGSMANIRMAWLPEHFVSGKLSCLLNGSREGNIKPSFSRSWAIASRWSAATATSSFKVGLSVGVSMPIRRYDQKKKEKKSEILVFGLHLMYVQSHSLRLG